MAITAFFVRLRHAWEAELWRAGVLSLALVWIQTPRLIAEAQTTRELQFTNSAPYSSLAEMKRRFGFSEPGRDYRIADERFTMTVPSSYTTNAGWGLLVWVSPGSSAWLPEDWKPELAKSRLLLVSANNSGNDRDVRERLRLALDATFNAFRRYPVDRKRIYVGGMSGGARVASELGVACADLFTGTLCVCGVNFYTAIPTAKGMYYPADYQPEPRTLVLAKNHGRFVLLTGEFDSNRENTKDVLTKGFQAGGFKNVLYLEVAGMKHAMPGAGVLHTALEYLDGKAAGVTNAPSGP